MDMYPHFSSAPRKQLPPPQSSDPISKMINPADPHVDKLIEKIIRLAEKNKTTVNNITTKALAVGIKHMENAL